jgi:methionyl-tRNA formyltransferase
MSNSFDEGPILVQGALPVSPDQNAFDLDLEKAIKAATYIPSVLRMVMDGDPGQPQLEKGSYFSKADHLALTKIYNPAALSSVELTRRLRAFACLQIRIADRWHEVTRIKQWSDQLGKNGRFCFRASDGVLIELVRFRHLPYTIYRFLA